MGALISNIILIIILVAIVGGASYYIYREKKKGVHCIGCPMAGNCAKARSGGCRAGK